MAELPLGQRIKERGWTTGSALPPSVYETLHQGTSIPLTPLAKEALQSPDFRVFVVSQECDVVAHSIKQEPYIECVVGTKKDKANPQVTSLRSLRILDIAAVDGTYFELQMQNRIWIDREMFASISPASGLGLDLLASRRLKKWCARRYGRAAFPDELVRRLGFNNLKSNGRKLLANVEGFVNQVRIQVAQTHEELPKGTDYKIQFLFILKLHPHLNQDQRDCLAELETYIRECEGIELTGFRSDTPDAVKVSDLLRNEEWHLEDMSLSVTPTSDEPEDGAGRA